MNKPTDAEIIALADETRTGEPGREGYILPISFARAVLAKWGQTAHSGEPVAFIYWPINGPPRLAWYSQKVLNDAILKTYEGHQPDVKLYTAPQPVEREPLTEAQINAAGKKMAECMDYPWAHMPEQGRAEMRKHAQAVIGAAYPLRGKQ